MTLATKTRYTFADLLEQAPEDETLYEILGGNWWSSAHRMSRTPRWYWN